MRRTNSEHTTPPAAPANPVQPEGPAQEAAPDQSAQLLPGELGQGLIEYALIIFLVAIVVIAILLLLGPQIGQVFTQIYATI